MERGIIHHNDGKGGQFRQQVLHRPSVKHLGIDIDCKQADGEQSLSDQGAERVDTTWRMPVMGVMASLASGCITVRARCILRKPTFINVDNGPAGSFIGSDLLLEDAPFVCVCFGMLQSFFYR